MHERKDLHLAAGHRHDVGQQQQQRGIQNLHQQWDLQFETVFYRFFLGSILTRLVLRKQLTRPSRSAIRTGVLLGLITCMSFTPEMFGITLTQTTKAAFLASTNLVILPLLYSLLCGSVRACVR